ncbi:MAG: hypothetical protein WA840_10280 [Caulobacteraceae bacterium]
MAELRRKVVLLKGETLFDGWAVERHCGDRHSPGLVLLTNWRLIFIDVDGVFSAAPIAKIDRVEILSSTQLIIVAWYDSLNLDFEAAGSTASVFNLLRQDITCQAVVVDRTTAPDGCEVGSRGKAAPGSEPGAPWWPSFLAATDGAHGDAPAAHANQRSLTAKPSL